MALNKAQLTEPKSSHAGFESDMDAEEYALVEAQVLAAFSAVLVDDPAKFSFHGSLARSKMSVIFRWLSRDVAPNLVSEISQALRSGEKADAVLDAQLPQILTDIRALESAASSSFEDARRLKAQMGGEEIYALLPQIKAILRSRPLLAKAKALGRACNSLTDDAALGTALQSMPLKSSATVAVLFHALVGEVQSVTRLVSAMIPIAGGANEVAIERSGFGPLIDAILAHAQNQVSQMSLNNGAYVDADKICTAIGRFHKLLRAITSLVEMERGSRWSKMTAELTKSIGSSIEPRLRALSADVSQSLRKPREGADRVDEEGLLEALNGMYLLAEVRDARESVALNTLFETVWKETGQSLEILINRNLDLYKANPADDNAARRFKAGIKMAEIRFGKEYADVLDRVFESVSRRV